MSRLEVLGVGLAVGLVAGLLIGSSMARGATPRSAAQEKLDAGLTMLGGGSPLASEQQSEAPDWTPVASAPPSPAAASEPPEAPEPAGSRATPDSSPRPTRTRTPVAGNTTWSTAVASWYGAELFGNRTACGQTYTSTLVGVAHKTLRCGTKVQIRYAGRTVTVPVVDRGPYIAGRTWDLTAATARALRFDGVQRVEWRLAS